MTSCTCFPTCSPYLFIFCCNNFLITAHVLSTHCRHCQSPMEILEQPPGMQVRAVSWFSYHLVTRHNIRFLSPHPYIWAVGYKHVVSTRRCNGSLSLLKRAAFYFNNLGYVTFYDLYHSAVYQSINQSIKIWLCTPSLFLFIQHFRICTFCCFNMFPSASLLTCTFFGILVQTKTWLNRWVVVTGSRLCIYKNNNSDSSRHIIL